MADRIPPLWLQRTVKTDSMRVTTIGVPGGRYRSPDRSRTAPSASGAIGTNLANFSDFAPGLGYWPVHWQPVRSMSATKPLAGHTMIGLALNDRVCYSHCPVGVAGTLTLRMPRGVVAAFRRRLQMVSFRGVGNHVA
jgi:hypothetical protein